jgi:hypothetical protein
MRNIFIGLSCAFDNTRNLEIKKTNKSKDFLEETKYNISTDNNENHNKTNQIVYIDLDLKNYNLSSNLIKVNIKFR